MINRIGLTKREDGYIVSTVEPPHSWHGTENMKQP